MNGVECYIKECRDFVDPLADSETFSSLSEERQEKIPTSRLKDSISTLSIFGIEISKTSSSYADFREKMKGMEIAFVESLKI